jgi:hypothetical protein
LEEDLVAVAEERGMGEVAKVPDPAFGKRLFSGEERSGQGGQASGKICQTITFQPFLAS